MEKPIAKCGFTKTGRLPRYLKEHGRFCLWRYEQVRDRWTKVPHQPQHPEYGASSTDPAHFTALEEAAAAGAGFDGIGLGIFGDLAAIDIDHCVAGDGRLSIMAQTIIDEMDTYTEYSPSGTGIRIIFRAPGVVYDTDKYYINNQNAADAREVWEHKQGLEVYIAGMTQKYVTVTGDVYRAADVNERAERIRSIVARYMAKPQPKTEKSLLSPRAVDISDSELIDVAYNAQNGAKFAALMNGDISGYASHSEADQALFNILSFYTGGDVERMIRLFSTSGLYRPDDGKPKYEKYLDRTARKAVEGCSQYYTPPQQRRELTEWKKQEPEVWQRPPEPRKPTDSKQAVTDFLKKVSTRAYEPIPTGIANIDKMLNGGFIRQTLITLGASPGAGKTILAQQMFEGIAEQGRADILFFNLEMSTEQLIARSLSRKTKMTQTEVLQGYRWTDEQAYKINVSAKKYMEDIAPYISYNPPDAEGKRGSPYYQDILAICETEAISRDPKKPLVVVIDYLQLLRSRTEKDDVETIKGALQTFKKFAIDRNAIVFLIMAHSRATNNRGVATQGAGRDTSAIEYSGDVQLSLVYGKIADGTYSDLSKMEEAIQNGTNGATEKDYNFRCVVCTKNRFGQDRGKAYMYFNGKESGFDMLDIQHNDEKPAKKKPKLW